jgi:N-acetylglucosaminyldiphosphoundecaprenol N-acetyl-beta-D-mannosaminyltransferase
MDQARRRKKVISLNIDSIGYVEALNKIIAAARDRSPGYVCFANVHMIVEAHKDQSFADDVNGSMLVAADGMPIINVLQSFYHCDQDRIAGMDAMPDIMRLAERLGLSIYFFGTTEEMLATIRSKTEKNFPKLKIAGLFSPPFGESLHDSTYIRQINDSGAHLVFVALGCPKQEKWMAMHSNKINAILLGVGGAFPVYAGVTRRAPRWMRDLSLEWAFRLRQEPSRLFKRYLKTNSLFLYLILKEKLKRMLNRSHCY